MGDTQMNRGAFFSIRDSQQIDKYKGLNTYQLYLSDVDRVGYVPGDVDGGTHNKFSLLIPDNQSGHIKTAMVRLKFIGMPITPDGEDAYGFGYLKSNFVKNCYSSKIGNNNQIVSAFGIDEVCVVESVQVPAITSVATVMSGVGGGTQAAAATNLGAVWDSQANRLEPLTVATQAPFTDVIRGVWNNNSKTLVTAKIGKPLSDNFILCDNPFGKTLSFELVGEDMTTLLPLGNAANEATVIGLEVKLLPDNQSNDRFSY